MDLYIVYDRTHNKALRIETDHLRAIKYASELAREHVGDEFAVDKTYLKNQWCDL